MPDYTARDPQEDQNCAGWVDNIAADVSKVDLTIVEARHRHHRTIEAVRACNCGIVRTLEGCSGAGTRWNAVPANILEPERCSGKYRWPQVER